MPRIPELLAPAGDEPSLRAALAAGADAVYFGLDDGFNARARAKNFTLEGLAATVARIHRAGARAYLTLNTLIFEPELAVMERLLRHAAETGIDAIILQDPAVALLARAVCPALELHASTQMTVSSPEAMRFAEGLGVTRVVLPRELSVEEIRLLASGTTMELEVFIHGALCVSWSGQCLTSEAWGGRSANRGQCAQSCRMPYDLVIDGEIRDLGDVRYLLSPRDLAGAPAVPELAAIGVHGLKIEGRQKGPEYVSTAVTGYRRWLDSIATGAPDEAGLSRDLGTMALAYSRGFSTGFLQGGDHQALVEGRFPKHRGRLFGRVRSVAGETVTVATEPDAPEVRPGMGVVFDDGHPEDAEAGGPIFAVGGGGQVWRLEFGRPGPDLGRVTPGQRVWITSDPVIARDAARLVAGPEPSGRHPIDLTVDGKPGGSLRVRTHTGTSARTHAGTWLGAVESEGRLEPARGDGLNARLLEEKLGALGGTPFVLRSLDAAGLTPGLHLPVSEIKELRRRLVAELAGALARGSSRSISAAPALDRILPPGPTRVIGGTPELVVLCRNDAQLEAVVDAGLPAVELDWMEMVGLGRAVARARAAGLRVTIATLRVQKPGEEGYDGRVARLEPDGVLVRHWGALIHFRERPARPAIHGDFSLNVTNSLTATHLLGLGLDTLTAAHDLDAAQLFALLERVPAERLTVAVHHHVPTFHTEHCVYAHLMSGGRDYRTCGRPCESHELSLRDHVGLVHPVTVDVGCRNTVFNAQAQSAAGLVPRLLARGVRRFRIELVRESRDQAATVIAAYRDLLAGRASPADTVRRAGAHEQFGVTRGTMKVLR